MQHFVSDASFAVLYTFDILLMKAVLPKRPYFVSDFTTITYPFYFPDKETLRVTSLYSPYLAPDARLLNSLTCQSYVCLVHLQVCDLEERIVHSVQDTLKIIELGNKLR